MATRNGVLSSSVGTKLVIGITGLALFLFLISHIAGNLLFLLGPTTFNSYSHMLLANPLIPVIELGLAVIFAIHIFKTVKMFLSNQQARPVAYVQKQSRGTPSRKTFSSTTMILSGLWLLVFVLIHVKQFKYGPDYAAEGSGIRDLYRLEVENFSSPLLVAFYVLSMTVVGSHLFHGIASACQSLGFSGPRWTPRLLTAAKAVAVIMAGVFMFIALYAHFAGVRS